MKSTIYQWSGITILLLITLPGCEVTSDRISSWKQSENGTPKLRHAVRDPSVKLPLRVEAAEALCDIGLFIPLAEDLKAVAEGDRKQIYSGLNGRLLKRMKGSNPQATSRVQLQAKDALASLREFADQTELKEIDQELISWLLGDWENRNEGEYSTDRIITAIGAAAAPVIVKHLLDTPAILVVLATHLHQIGHQPSQDAAAEKLVGMAQIQKPVKLATFHALGKIGSVKAISYLNDVARKGELQHRVWALRSMALFPHPSILPTAAQIAGDTGLKGDQAVLRDEAFSILEKSRDPKGLEILCSFLESKEELFRYQAIESIITGFGVQGLQKLLVALPSRYIYKKRDVKDFIEDQISSKLGKKAIPALLEALSSESWIARLIAIKVLGTLGSGKEGEALEKLVTDTTRLRGWDAGATVGSEAKAAVERIKNRK